MTVAAAATEEPLTSLYWECGDLEYSLHGDLEDAGLVALAKSIDCS